MLKALTKQVQKLQVKMILMYVILVLLIWVTLSHWKSLNLLWNWVLSFWYVELCVLIYLTRKCIKFERRIDDTWDALAERLVEDVCGTRWGKDRALMSDSDRSTLVDYIKEMKFLPGGRYLYYAGRMNSFFNNCFLLRGEEDTREEWGSLLKRASDCLMTGGGIGVDYSRFRAAGKPLSRTGGISSGPIPLMQSINEHGREKKIGYILN